jgi:hypothetical protein
MYNAVVYLLGPDANNLIPALRQTPVPAREPPQQFAVLHFHFRPSRSANGLAITQINLRHGSRIVPNVPGRYNAGDYTIEYDANHGLPCFNCERQLTGTTIPGGIPRQHSAWIPLQQGSSPELTPYTQLLQTVVTNINGADSDGVFNSAPFALQGYWNPATGQWGNGVRHTNSFDFQGRLYDPFRTGDMTRVNGFIG